MDLSYYIKEHDYFSERIVDNYEFRLAEYIMIDMCEASEDGYFIDHYNECFYLKELHENLLICINNFIIEQDETNSYNDNARNYLIKFVQLLKIVDYKILNLPTEIREEMEIFPFEKKAYSRPCHILINGDGSTRNEIITILHTQLSEFNLIEVGFQDFQKHFVKDEKFEKIMWRGPNSELANLFSSLKEMKILSDTNLYILAANHFTDKNNKILTNIQLRKALEKKSHHPIVNEIMLKLKV